MTAEPARITFLGTGTSSGVPSIGCTCAVCRSTDPRDKRLRPSIYVNVPGRAAILVDTSPDLRQQALTHDVTRVDAILFTHSHADHILGLDEIRRFNFMQRGAIPCYATSDVWTNIRRTFHYIFDGVPRLGGGIPMIEAHEIDGPFAIAGVQVVPVPLLARQHADSRVSVSAALPISPTAAPFQTSRGGSSKTSTLSSSTRCATRSTRRTSPWTRRWPRLPGLRRGAPT